MPNSPFIANAAVDAVPQTVTMLCLLSGSDGSGYSHDYVRRVVLAWAVEKFPRLLPGGRDPAFSFDLDLNGVRMTGHSRDNEGASWAFRCEHPETGAATRRWRTEVCLQHREGVDQLGVRNSYLGEPSQAVRSTQPRFLRQLVEHLTYRDAGVRVGDAPLFAQTGRAFESFCDHAQSPRRTLPLVVMTPRSTPAGEDLRLGCNPWPLAQWLCGLAHVVVTAQGADDLLQRRLGPMFGVPAGGATVFPPVGRVADATEPELFAPPFDAGPGLKALLQHQVYTGSHHAGRKGQFESLWRACC